MAEAAAHLVDHVIPKVAVRQWVLSFPIPLRSLFAVHPDLLLPVLQIIHRPHPHASGAGRAAATARAGETGGSVSGGVRCKTGLDFDRAGGGVRTALGQTLRWRGIQAR